MMYVAIIAVGSPSSPLVVLNTAADERAGLQRRVGSTYLRRHDDAAHANTAVYGAGSAYGTMKTVPVSPVRRLG